MKKYFMLYKFLPSVLFVFGSVYMTGVQASAPESRGIHASISSSQQLYTVSNSDAKITLEITVDGKTHVQATQFDGGQITIEKIGSSIYQFTPYIVDKDTGTVAVRAFQIRSVSKAGRVIKEGNKEVDSVGITSLSNGGFAVFNDSTSGFTFRVVKIQRASDLKNGNMRELPIRIPRMVASCCVTCGGIRSCACAVEASCGSCCNNDCCPPKVT